MVSQRNRYICLHKNFKFALKKIYMQNKNHKENIKMVLKNKRYLTSLMEMEIKDTIRHHFSPI